MTFKHYSGVSNFDSTWHHWFTHSESHSAILSAELHDDVHPLTRTTALYTYAYLCYYHAFSKNEYVIPLMLVCSQFTQTIWRQVYSCSTVNTHNRCVFTHESIWRNREYPRQILMAFDPGAVQARHFERARAHNTQKQPLSLPHAPTIFFAPAIYFHVGALCMVSCCLGVVRFLLLLLSIVGRLTDL